MAFGKSHRDPFATSVGHLIEKATFAGVQTEDWGQFLHICDIINTASDGPKDAVKALKKRISKNYNHKEIELTLSLIDMCMQNCGPSFQSLIVKKEFVKDSLVKLLQPRYTLPLNIQNRILNFIKTWSQGFPGGVDVSEVKDVYLDLLKKGVHFPPSEAEAEAAEQETAQVSSNPPTSVPTAPALSSVIAPKNSTITLVPEQIGKLHSELDMVKMNVKVMSAILMENIPGSENPEDMELLQKLYKTGREMQERIMDLLVVVENEDVTIELIQVNEDLNNAILGYERFTRNQQRILEQNNQREDTNAATEPSAPSCDLLDLSPSTPNHRATLEEVNAMNAELSHLTMTKNDLQQPNYYEVMEFDPLAPAVTTEDPALQMITITKETGLGLKILGGINRNEGPFVYIQEIIPGGDCYKDGRLKPGDQFVSINKESMIGVSFEEAKSIITRAKLRSEPAWEIAFIRQRSDGSHTENPPCTPLLQTSGEYGPQASAFNLLSSPPEIPIPKTSSTPKTTDAILPSLKGNQLRTGYKKTEQTSVVSLDHSPTDMSNTDAAPVWTDNYGPQGRTVSLNPSVRLKAEKLEMALNYLGIQPTKEQQQALRQQVAVDPQGTVSFGDFVQVARNLFCLQLDEVNVGAREMSSILDSQFIACDSLEADDVERLKRERNDALEEVNALKTEPQRLLRVQAQTSSGSSSGVMGAVPSPDPPGRLPQREARVQEAKAVIEETRALRSRIHLAEAAQRQARGMETDYEEVIRLLEAEITELKAQLADYSDQNKGSVQELRKRITVLDCQLRKSEVARKTFEASTEKLLHFVEAIQEVFSDNCAPLSTLSERRALLASQTSLTSLGRNGRSIPASLALESKELVKSVRAILDMDCLPYGWEEAYTADGIKYFINHVTQTTSWIHPVASALSLSCSEENEEDCPRDLPDQKS
ncbi:Syntaxin-binding protein 4 [Myotis davidii]|uniref:Syntaxin-binding protein 4 n=1 Tax=Myotis davidii TaxID=225400 RepID=L5MIT2_MYODS|nr:Syntaxin-binding protein 4 [Myotis davidii]